MADSYSDIEKNQRKGRSMRHSQQEEIRDSMMQYLSKREQKIIKNRSKGWGAPYDKPYQPLGKFNNVLDAFTKCKTAIPHTKEIRIDTLKAINFMKNSNNPVLKGKPLKRCLDFVKSNKHTLDQLKAADRYKSFYKLGNSKTFSEDEENHDVNIQAKFIDNKKLNTPYFKIISNIKDGSNALKEEISKSVERMKKARHGHSINEIYKNHDYSFYMPEKTSYISKAHEKFTSLNNDNSICTSIDDSKFQSKVFKTEVLDERVSIQKPTKVRVKSNIRSNTSFSRHHKKNNSVQIKNMKFRELKNRYTSEMQSIPIQYNSIDFIIKENNKNCEETKVYHKSINDIFNYKSTRPSIEDSEVRMISYINSKPIQPYISLLPLQNFLKKEQEFSRKGMIGSSSFNTISNNRSAVTSNGRRNKSEAEFDNSGQINWSKLLIEELTDIMKK